MRRELIAALILSVALTACGGGGSSNGNGNGSGGGGNSVLPPVPLTITTTSLPQGVQGSSYTTALTANGGTSPYKWTVTPSLPAGLSLDGDTGAISGIPGSSNSYSFTVHVSDSASPPNSVNASLGLFINSPLSVYDVGVLQLQQWTAPSYRLTAIGGFGGNSLQITGGSLPAGVRMDSQGFLSGAPQTAGTFTFTVTATDSYSPPNIATDTMTAVVSIAPFYIAASLPQSIPLNRPFSGTIIASGGTPPYIFSASGSLPPGLGPIDPSTGQISGTPTTTGNYFFNVSASDASSPPKTAFQTIQLRVAAPLGRNDSSASATRLGNGAFQASISPFTDAPNVTAPDTDYYCIIATAGSTVHVETFAKRYYPNTPLDTVLEITDQNGVQLTTGCNQPGGTTTDFSSPCLNDDISASPHVQDSVLDYKAPVSTPTQTVLVHVLDWSGNARPDMIYNLQISGVVDPLVFSPGPSNFYCIINNLCSPFIVINGGAPPINYSVSAGTLPPGVKLSGNTLSGVATSTGTYNFTIQATDQVNQTATLQQSLTVVPQLALITTSLPSAKANIATVVQLQGTGGVPPYFWGIGSVLPANLLASIDGTGKLTYVATQPGTYNIPISISENSTYQQVSASLSVTITP